MLRTRRLPLLLSTLALIGAAYGLAPIAHAAADPVIAAADVPSTVDVDVAASFDVTVTDADAAISSISWNFGDGSAAAGGAQTSHAYGIAGTYTVTVAITDTLGTEAVQSFTVTAVPGSAAATAAATTTPPPPTLRFTATQTRTRWTLARGTVFKLSPSLRADVMLTFARRGKGSQVLAAHPLGTLDTNVAAGNQQISFDGRLGADERLRPGNYSVTMIASSVGLTAAPVTLDFTIRKATLKPKSRRGAHARRLRQRDRSR